MRHPSDVRTGRCLRTAAAACTVALLLTPASRLDAKRRPPARTTYFVVTVGVEDRAAIDAGCLRFDARRVCMEPADYPKICGTWEITDDAAEQRGLAMEIEWNASGIILELDGRVRLDGRGKGSAIAGAGRLAAEDLVLESNWSFAGKETTRKECRRLAKAFVPLAHQWSAARCLARARFGDPADSPYVLPYSVGEAYWIGQVYCEPAGSHRSSFAYDIMMPVGTPIVSVADGVVWMAMDEFENGDHRDEHSNDIFIEHDDGSVAEYGHLRHGSYLVQAGDRVSAGQVIAASGDTGTTVPHLHFIVFANRNIADSNSVPVNFRNAEGELDERRGLILGETYEALPW